MQLASELPHGALVLHGDGTDEDLLEDEGIEDIDLFLSLTSDDEGNIMASLLAKRLGARRVLALINRRSYADLMNGTQIDIVRISGHRGRPFQPIVDGISDERGRCFRLIVDNVSA